MAKGELQKFYFFFIFAPQDERKILFFATHQICIIVQSMENYLELRIGKNFFLLVSGEKKIITD